MKEKIEATCDSIKQLLLDKNVKYGNSALEPVRVFSKASTTEQLLVRIDDKLSRIKTTGMEAPDEDTLNDLIGYLILLKIAKNNDAETQAKELIDNYVILTK
jgi:hypothetical protein